MSTKCSVAAGDQKDLHWHLYEECFDFRDLYLEMYGEDVRFDCATRSITVNIPIEVFDEMATEWMKVRKTILNRAKEHKIKLDRDIKKKGLAHVVAGLMHPVLKQRLDYDGMTKKLIKVLGRKKK